MSGTFDVNNNYDNIGTWVVTSVSEAPSSLVEIAGNNLYGTNKYIEYYAIYIYQC